MALNCGLLKTGWIRLERRVEAQIEQLFHSDTGYWTSIYVPGIEKQKVAFPVVGIEFLANHYASTRSGFADENRLAS